MDNLEAQLPTPYHGFHMRSSDKYCIISNNNWQTALKVMKTKGLKNLELNPNFINFAKNEDLSFLEQFDFIEGLNVITPNLNSSFPFHKFLNLKELFLEYNEKILVNYSVFSKLENCFLDWRTKGSETINTVNNLTSLRVDNYRPYDLKEISSLRNLKKLKFVDGKMHALSFIEEMKDLTLLQIYSCKNLSSIEDISELKNLEVVCFENCNEITSIKPISELENLREFVHKNNGTIDTIQHIYSLNKLEKINLYGTNIADGKLQVLHYLSEKGNLKNINFMNRKNYSHTREQLGWVPPNPN